MALDADDHQKAQQNLRLRATTAIVGGGASGGGVLHHLVKDYLDRLQTDPTGTPDLRVNFYEVRGQYGFGGPYGVEPPVFRLNQPASNMSIDQHNPGSFIAWFNEWRENQSVEEVAAARALYKEKTKDGLTESQISLQYPNEYILAKRWNESDFLPRTFYGTYLRAEFEKTLNLADKINTQLGREAIVINRRNAKVDGATVGEDQQLILSGEEGGDYHRHFNEKADAAVIATGHRKNDFLAEYQQHPDYLDTPMTINLVMERLANASSSGKPIVIAGTSQSMLDALAAIDAVGYKGKIIAISSSAVEPWPFDPAKEAFPDNNYPLKYLTRSAIKKLAENSGSAPAAAQAFRALLVKEMHSPEAIAAGPGHVLKTLRAQQDTWRKSCTGCPGLFDKVTSMLDETAGNSTFTDRFLLFQKFKQEGRLELRAGRVNGAAATVPHGFDVEVTDSVTGKREAIPASKLINCASMQRVPYYIDPETRTAHSPDGITESALQAGLLVIDNDHKTINAAPQSNVGIVGPAHGGAWGIPYTRDQFEQAAKEMLDTALARAKPVAAPTPQTAVVAVPALAAPRKA